MRKSSLGRRHGFTLVEMLVAVTILVLIMVLATQMIGATSKMWKNTTTKIEAFQGARDGFQLMTDELRQATLNTYWDYFNSAGLSKSAPGVNLSTFVPTAYGRNSDLSFVSGARPAITTAQMSSTNPVFTTQGVAFTAPLGYTAIPAQYGKLQSTLNGTAFYLEYGNGHGTASPNLPYANSPPTFLGITLPYRARLVQFVQPTESLTVYNYNQSSNVTSAAWFQTYLINAANHTASVRVVANNIVALIISPQASDNPTDNTSLTNDTYAYDSRLGLKSGASTTAITGAFSFASWTPGSNSQPLMMNQMPPIIRVAMVAIDEPSANILTLQNASPNTVPTAIGNAYNQASGAGNLFSDPRNLDSDLLAFQTGPTGLASAIPHINFRVFETTVTVKSARFSTQ